ncbi:hypothetical protein NPIL_458661 [Nephila pilipes]|uniref:Secreted protein n=1 Tax=Nephila pilipes TaxID=299642 RepID=A0A8X6TRA8_NEPPI|nr:hypothetical protein NPIL_458661 [Nephila pilipes]
MFSPPEFVIIKLTCVVHCSLTTICASQIPWSEYCKSRQVHEYTRRDNQSAPDHRNEYDRIFPAIFPLVVRSAGLSESLEWPQHFGRVIACT